MHKSLASLASYCPMLEELDLTRCGVTDDGIILISKHCRGLIHCRVANSNANELSDSSIISLATNCKMLQSLDIFGSPGISDLSLLSLAIHSHHLKSVNFDDCDRVTRACWDMLELNAK